MLYKLYHNYVKQGNSGSFTKLGQVSNNEPQQYMEYIKDLESNKAELMNII